MWTTILPIVTGTGGFIGGILSEPFKQLTTQWLTKRNLKRLVFAEFAHNLDTLVTIVEGNKGKPIGANIAKKFALTFLKEGPIIIAATTILKRCDDDMLQKHLRIKDLKRYRLLKDLNKHLTSLESRRQ